MTDIFNTDQKDQLQIDPSKDYLDELVGDGKKFKTVQDLARGKLEADNYIKTLEKGRDELREDYLRVLDQAQNGPKVKELIDQFMSQQQSSNSNNTQSADEGTPPSFDIKDVEKLFASKFQEMETQKRQQANYETFEKKLQESYGSDYARIFQQKVSELGMSMDFAKQTAFNHPTVLIKALGLDQQKQEQFHSAPSTSQRIDRSSSGSQERNWAYYEKLRKEEPATYWDPKTQVQMHLDSSNPNFGL